MTNVIIKQLANVLTILRLILALPVCLLILNEKYSTVLWVAFIAGPVMRLTAILRVNLMPQVITERLSIRLLIKRYW